jgi:16S rRNA processing protein RimM
LLVRFAEVADRTAAEALRGTLLVADSASSAAPVDDDELWDHDLVGLWAVTADGRAVGTVADVLHPPGPPLLAVRRPDGAELLIPFVRAIVPTVDLQAGQVVVTPPDGLLEL